MFDEEFYPTPAAVIREMLKPFKGKVWCGGINGYQKSGFKLEGKIILEPSAGKGDILDYINGRYILKTQKYKNGNEFHETSAESADIKQIYCCEKDPNLKHILRDKGYRVIADDFLNYTGDYFFDMIIMNPPFSNGDEHLLKAWEILEEGDIICLLNSETLDNPFSEKRKLLKAIIEQYGTVEKLGQVFSTAERKTEVEVSLVRLKKKCTKDKFNFEFENITEEKKFHIDESDINDAPALKDIIGNMLLQYEKIKETYIEYVRVAKLLDHYGAPLIKDRDNAQEKTDIFNLAQSCYRKTPTVRGGFNNFCDGMKENMWSIVFENLSNIASFDMDKFMTHSIRQNFTEFVQKESQMDFTRENVWNIITMLHDNKHNILEKCIEEVFDIFTSYYKENRVYVEGWKTNDRWKVNKRIILPRGIKYGAYCSTDDLRKYGSKFDIEYSTASEYSDIDKALDYIVGGRPQHVKGIRSSLEDHFRDIGTIKTGDKFVNSGTSAYFNWKFWKKGTLHLEFKDLKLWEEFNLRACAGKNWLPDNEKKEWQARKEKQKRKDEQPKFTQLLIE